MGKYADEINILLYNPKLYQFNPILYRYYTFIDMLNDSINRLNDNQNLTIYGGGIHTVHVLKCLSLQNRKKIKIIIDKEIKKDIYQFGVEYIQPEKLPLYSVDTILVSEFNKRKEIVELIKQQKSTYKVIDIYELIKGQNVDSEVCFYSGVEYSYDEVSKDLEKLCDGGSTKTMKKIIGEYLHIRDFKNAFAYIDKLIAASDEEICFYQSIKEKVQQNLAFIHEKISDEEHIVINLIDALRPEEIVNMSFLSDLKKSGMYFQNAYSVAPYTSATLKTMFKGQLYIDDKLYKINSLAELEDSELYHKLVKTEYQFKYFGGKEPVGIFFNGCTYPYFYVATHGYSIASAVWQWEAVNYLEETIGKKFIIIHNLAETHEPYINGIQKNLKRIFEPDLFEAYGENQIDTKNKIIKQIATSREYLDGQLEFYYQLYSDVKYRIFFSDHGQYRGEKAMCFRGYTHVFFLLLGENVCPEVKEKMFSLVSFPQFASALLNDSIEDIDACLKDYVLSQTDDCYSEKYMKSCMVNPIAFKGLYIQHRGVISPKDAYVKKVTGEEFYFVDNEDKNLIQETKYQSRIDELRKNAGNQFINIKKEKKYAFSKKYYEALQSKIDKNISFIESTTILDIFKFLKKR